MTDDGVLPMPGRDAVEILGEETPYRGFFSLTRYRLRHRLFAGGWSEIFTREVFRRRDAVGLLLYDPLRDEVALVEQFRIGCYAHGDGESWSLEVVAGVIDSGETPAQVAAREALEEANCAVTAVEPIAEFFPSPGGSDEYFHLFCGRADLAGAGGIFGLPEEHEDIRVRVFSSAAVFALLARREIRNSLTLVALQWLQLNRDRLRAQWH